MTTPTGDPAASLRAHEVGQSLRRAALVVNTASRTGRNAFEQARLELARGGLELVAAHAVADPARLRDVIDDVLALDVDLLVLGGGDGTVSSVARRLADAGGTVLGLLPTGTANDLARTLEVPVDLAAACRTVLQGKVVDIDLGTVAGRSFVNLASVGLSVGVTTVLSPLLKRRLGSVAYPVAALRAYRAHVPFAARLEFPDGDHASVELHDLLQLAVANGRFYGGGNVAAPDAGIDDHLLDVYAIPRGTLLQRLGVARHFVSGAFTARDHVVHLTTRSVRLSTDEPMPVNVDGEVETSTPQTFGVRRNALRVVVPGGSSAASYDG